MNKTNVQANASQVDAAAQPVNGNGVVDQNLNKESNPNPAESATVELSEEMDVPPLLSDEEDWELFEQITFEERTKVINALEAGKEVQLRDFLKAGLGFANMPNYLQRLETKKNVNDLMKSLLKCKHFYRAIEIVSARDFIEAGLGTPKRLDGTPISINDPDVDYLYVRPDGKQRSCAYANLFSDKSREGTEGDYDVRVKICPAPTADLDIYIREIQTAAVWDEKTKRHTTVAQFDNEESGLTVMNYFMEDSKMSARAAYKLIYYKDGYKKSLYDESVSTGQLHIKFNASPEIIKRAKHNYECMKIAFRASEKYLKNSAAVDALIDVYTSATNNQNEAVEDFLTFLMSLQAEDFKVIGSVASVAEKTNEFIKLFNKYKKRSSDSDFMAKVTERVESAKSEYKSHANTKVVADTMKCNKVSKEVSYFAVGAHSK